MIAAEQVTKVFSPQTAREVRAVDGVSLTVRPGEIVGLLGPNGAGKTTLLRLLAAILTPTAGRCIIDGIRTDHHPQDARRRVGFLSGSTRLYKRLRAGELLRFFGRLYGLAEDHISRRIDELQVLLDMHTLMDRRCDSLSTGETQKVSIARALLHEPAVLILDEPTSGLDILTGRTILQFIRSARDDGHAILFSTHTMSEAELLCDHMALMHRGRIRAVATRDDLLSRTGTESLHDAFEVIVREDDSA